MAEKMNQTPASVGPEGEREFSISITPEELLEAVGCYDLLLPSEIGQVYEAMVAVPQFGVRVASALQFAAKNAKTPEEKSRILDAAVVPAFLVGMLVGMMKPKPEQPEDHSEGFVSTFHAPKAGE